MDNIYEGLDPTLILVVMVLLVVAAVFAVLAKSLLKAAIALGLASAVLTVAMFLMGSYLAAVFELSVCAGLVTVVFISAISLTKPVGRERTPPGRLLLPFLLLAAAAGLFLLWPYFNAQWAVNTGAEAPVQELLWNARRVDVLGQVIVILAGAAGVSVLFKERAGR